MFIDNKYNRWYFSIISTAKSKLGTRDNVYVEKHHVYPTSIFGKNDYTVLLTAKEHYVCHWLLTKFTEGKNHRKMAHALMQMTNHKVGQRPTWSSLEYRIAKETLSAARKGMKFSLEHRTALSESHKGKKQSEETKAKRSESIKRAWADGSMTGSSGKKLEFKDPEARGAKISAALTGRPLSEEHKRKIAESGSGGHWTGKTRSEETRAKMAEARRRWWAEKRVAAG